MTALFTESDIKRLVHAFYGSVRKDDLLAPIFAQKIPEDHWPHHMKHIGDFWSGIFLKTGRFDGNPLQKHLAVNGLTPEHFGHWLWLFKTTADEVLSPEQADAIFTMAQRVAQSLQMGIAFHHETSGKTDHAFTAFAVRRRD